MDSEQILEVMRKDKAVRRAIVRKSHKIFFHYYLGHYIEFPIAPFHEELFELTQNDSHSMVVLSAFRNSGKSTLLTLSYVIWSIISGRTKFILIVSETQPKAQLLLDHIKQELEKDGPLKQDLGPFQEERGWTQSSLTIKNYGAKIMAVSIEQNVRGVRHLNHRPDLILLDDCESQESVRTVEGRDKLFRRLSGEIIPAGHSKTMTIVIGSMLHPDSLIPRLQKGIDAGKIDGTYRMYPILDENNRPTWPGKYPNLEAVEAEKARGVSDQDWLIEYLLIPFVSEGQIIKPEDITYYDELPETAPYTGYRETVMSVDLAISEKASADYTAIVAARIYGHGNDRKIYVLPHPTNERMKARTAIDRIASLATAYGNGIPVRVFFEDVGFQKAYAELAQEQSVPAETVSLEGQDKRARLMSAAPDIQTAKVVFPRNGCELLLTQLFGFGYERHDDLVDALTLLVLKYIKDDSGGRILVPSVLAESAPLTLEELEQEADVAQRLEQEYERSQFARLMQPRFRQSWR